MDPFVNMELKFYFLKLNKGSDLNNIIRLIKSRGKKLKIVKFTIIEENGTEALLYVQLSKEIDKKQISLDTNIYLDKNKMNAMLMTDDEKEQLFILDSFINEMSPFAVPKFIKSKEIIDIINDFLKEGYFISSSMVASKKWWEKVQRTRIDYAKDVPIKEVLIELERKKSFINSIILNFFNEDRSSRILKVYISRKGIIKFLDGHYELFKKKILEKIITENFAEQKLLENRARKDSDIKPFKLTFGELQEIPPIKITKQFAKSIVKSREFSLSIYHNGNPYFHANVTNLLDGSVFTILFHNTKKGSELIVTPQYSTSSNSLSKFLSIVYSKFGEGVIGEYSIGD